MPKLSFNDWQTMHARKELEEIHKSMTKPDVVSYALLSDIVIALIGVGSEQDGWFIVSGIALLITFIIWLLIAISTWRRQRLRARIKSIREVIDLFDNKICYYLMTAQTMYESGVGTSTNDERFNLIEASYYTNKCVAILASVDNNILNAITPSKDEYEYRSGKISAARMANVLGVLEDLYENIQNTICPPNASIDHEMLKRIYHENQYYRKELDRIKKILHEIIDDTLCV